MLKRLDLSASEVALPFLAEWKIVDLAHVPKVRIKGARPRDHERPARRRVAGVLGHITRDQIECQPHQTTFQTLALTVTVLQPLAADESKAKS